MNGKHNEALNSLSSQEKVTTNNNEWLNNFEHVYQNLTKHNLKTLNDVYHESICFEDPLHKVEGINNFIAYFENLYTNVISCKFIINHSIETPTEAGVYWEMQYQHPKLNSGKTITVVGHSHLKSKDDKIIYHRDYLDAGSMLYEQIPLLGSAVRFIKKRIQS